METDAIEIRGLRKKLGSFLLDDVDIVVPEGFIAGFVGPNGAGKTTTLKALLGLSRPDAGMVKLLGGSPDDPAVRDRIGVVLDQPAVNPDWQVDTIGRRIGRFWSRWDAQEYRDLLERFDVPTRIAAGTLSKGQAVKLGLALALAHHPDVLVLDEPSSGLDPVARADLADVLRGFVVDGRRSVLVSTHITGELDGLADYIHVLIAGRIAFSGELEELHERFAVVRAAGDPPPPGAPMIGLRRDGDRWEALIDVADTASFPANAVIDPATTDDVVVHLARHHSTEMPSA